MFFGTFVVLQTTHTYLLRIFCIRILAKYLKGSIVNFHYAVISLSFAKAFKCYTTVCILQFCNKKVREQF